MTTIGFDQTLIARVASGLYNLQLGNATMDWALEWVNGGNGTVSDLANQVYTRDFGAVSTADVASILVTNLGITGADLVAAATDTAKSYLDAAAPGARGAAVVELMNLFSGVTIPGYVPFVAAYNAQVAAAVTYAQITGTVDVALDQPESMEGKVFTLFGDDVAAGAANVMRLTGDQDVRIDFTNPANQVTGLDKDGDGLIEFDGIERSITGVAADFEIVDAYARNPLNHGDTANNFLGDIAFDGTAFDGDGVSTDGNIFLGGLGVDNAFGGVGNDFMAGGGIAQGRTGFDAMRGGRNADFFFAEFSGIDATDGGQTLFVDGGNTADDSSAGVKQSPQDADWLLLEASDDDEPVIVTLEETDAGVNDDDDVLSRSGESMDIDDVEHLDASGNLYGFIDDIDVEIGGRAVDTRDEEGSTNYGFGSSAQLRVQGSEVANIVIAGYDNDFVWGAGGDDLLFGGNLQFLFETVEDGVTNPNLAGIKLNGRDELYGDAGDDNIVLELDKGVVSGGDGNDTLWITNYTVGRFAPTEAGSAAAILDDGKIRIDLGYSSYRGYRGDTLGEGTDHSDEANDTSDSDHVPGTADQTNYTGYAKTTIVGMESVIATGMGGIDYLAAGTNDPELNFANQQNHYGTAIDLELRGTDGGEVVFFTEVEVTDGITDDELEALYQDYLIAWALDNFNGIPFFGAEQFGDFLDDYGFDLQESFNVDVVEITLSAGANTLYAGTGDDILEGRGGNDKLSGGPGNDDFVFALQDDYYHGEDHGDNVDVIHRQQQDPDADANITDGTFGQDFGLDESSTTGVSVLAIRIEKAAGNAPGDELDDVVAFVAEIKTGVKENGTFTPVALNTDAIKAATTYQGLTDALNDALDATPFGADLQATLQSDGITIFITDAKGRELADNRDANGDRLVEVAGGGVTVSQRANTATDNYFQYGEPEVAVSQDRLIYKSYEDRSKNEGTDDDSYVGSSVSLGEDNYANDLVIDFDTDGTRLAEDQQYAIEFVDLSVEDIVTMTVNDVKYELQVGVQLDGSLIGGESNNAFVARFAAYINTFLDDDTAAGRLVASATNGFLVISQGAYNDGEEVVFMREPVVSISNLSGGQRPDVSVTNISSHEVHLLDFDGRDGELNRDNVLFVGEEFINRAVLETAADAGGTLLGSDAEVVYVANNVAGDNITSSAAQGLDSATIKFNATANQAVQNLDGPSDTNFVAPDNFAVHGDDLLIGGEGRDSIWGGTGDDRIHGSAGGTTTNPERVDGGKDLYLANGQIRVLNDYEAEEVRKAPSTVNFYRIDQNETGGFLETGFQDTLLWQQRDFGVVGAGGAKFYIELADDVNRKQGGEGWVTTTEGAATTGFTYFTNMEHIRTVAGDGTLAGQGDDTLDFADLSLKTGGVFYNLSNNTVLGPNFVGSDAGFPNSPTLGSAGPGSVLINFGDNWTEWLDDSQVTPAMTGVAPINPANPSVADNGPDGDTNDTGFGDNDGNDQLFIVVDGVENVVGGTGDDGIYVDETEAGKNNSFRLGTGADIVLYGNDFDDGAHLASTLVPTVTIMVNTAADTDTIEMIRGRVGTVAAKDTLVGVEAVSFAIDDDNIESGAAGGAAASSREDDLIDVSRISGATVDFTNGYITSGGTVEAGGVAQLIVYGMSEFEAVLGSAANDGVIISNAMFNSREDFTDGDDDEDVTFDSFLNYDFINDADSSDAGTAGDDKDNDGQVYDRMSVAELRAIGTTGTDINPYDADDIPEGYNLTQYEFDLGAGNADTVDYFAETGLIAALITPGVTTSKILVSHDGDEDLSDDNDRVDQLTGVERIVAAQGESILDFTNAGSAVQIDFQFPPTRNGGTLGTGILAEDDVIESVVRIADGNGNVITGLSSMIERYIVGDYETDGGAQNVAQATWNRIEGSDFAERVTYDGSENLLDQAGIDHRYSSDILNLRGGANNVSYSPLETSIAALVSVTAFNAALPPANAVGTDPLAWGNITVGVGFTNGEFGTPLDNGGAFHTITSYSSDNPVSSGSLKLEASQDAEDSVTFNFDTDKVYVLGQSPGVISVSIGSSATMVLTGFEVLQDWGGSDDVYTMEDLDDVLGDLFLVDDLYSDAPGTADRDTLKINDDEAINYNNGAATFSNEVDTVKLESFNDAFGFDFSILDISELNDNDLRFVRGDDDNQDDDAFLNAADTDYEGPADRGGLNAIFDPITDGDADSARDLDDEVVLGDLDSIEEVTLFSSIHLTDASISSSGSEFELNTDTGELLDGDGDLLFATDTEGLNFSRLTGTAGVTVDVVGGLDFVEVIGSKNADDIEGEAGDDIIRGGGGNDTLSGGVEPEELAQLSFTFNAGAIAQDGTVAAYVEVSDGTGAIRFYQDGTIEGDATGAFVGSEVVIPTPPLLGLDSGSSADRVGQTIEAISVATWNTFLPNFTLASVDYDASGNDLVFTYASGEAPVAADLTIEEEDNAAGDSTLEANTVATDLGAVNSNLLAANSPEVNSADTFIFEATGSANGTDTINTFDSNDVLDFSLFFSTSNIVALNAVLTANPGVSSVENDVNRLVEIVGGQDLSTASGLAAALASGGEYANINMANSSKAIFITADSSDADETQYVFMATSSSTGTISVTLVGMVTDFDIDTWALNDFAG
ncbi:MAG: hypothetical protein IPF94_08985 [Betaproteobacteria bacterium]|nr:hypothetical protein [Betaproteobacteria bacterium]